MSGEYSTTLSIANVTRDMNGWGAFCTFYYAGQTARTSTAYMYVEGTPKPTPTVTPKPVPAEDQSGSFSGYVTDYTYSNVSIYVMDGPGYVSQVSRGICDITGDLCIGAPCTLYYDGIGAHGPGFYYVSIQGEDPEPEIRYGSMSGTAYHDTAFTVYIVLANGSSYHVNGYLCDLISGVLTDGCSCVAYYTEPLSESSIYSVDIYGTDPVVPTTPTPTIDDQGGWAGSNYPYDEMEDYTYDDGGWAGSNYPYDEMEDYGDGGWAGSNYDDDSGLDDGWVGSALDDLELALDDVFADSGYEDFTEGENG